MANVQFRDQYNVFHHSALADHRILNQLVSRQPASSILAGITASCDKDVTINPRMWSCILGKRLQPLSLPEW